MFKVLSLKAVQWLISSSDRHIRYDRYWYVLYLLLVQQKLATIPCIKYLSSPVYITKLDELLNAAKCVEKHHYCIKRFMLIVWGVHYSKLKFLSGMLTRSYSSYWVWFSSSVKNVKRDVIFRGSSGHIGM